MKVFISWSGSKSKAAALALRKWLPDVIQRTVPWMSQHDIDAGSRWNAELSSQLDETRFGIICLTRTNLTEPWLMFEAGALSKHLSNSFVCPYLIDLEPSGIPAGPLAQFQAKRANPPETLELLQTINRLLDTEALPDENLKRIFERCWCDLEAAFKNLPDEEPPDASRPLPDMVEEILSITRGLSRSVQRLQVLDKRIDDLEPPLDLSKIERIILDSGLSAHDARLIISDLMTVPYDWHASPGKLKRFLNDSISKRLEMQGNQPTASVSPSPSSSPSPSASPST